MGCCTCKMYINEQAQITNIDFQQLDSALKSEEPIQKEKILLVSDAVIENTKQIEFQAQVQAVTTSTMKLTPEMLVRKQCITEKFLAHYEIERKLGQGGFGEVYLVKHIATKQMRAVKIILRKSISCEEKLLEETEILKTLDHPNIVKILEIFADFKFYYIITEYCSGGELLERIKTITNYNEKLTAQYMKQIFSAIMYCHSKNIVHRDLKPENILFDSRDPKANLKVIDFGASEKMVDQSFLTKKIGTPFYVAPEVLSETGYDEKVDIWSCGVLLYILLSGKPPFKGHNDVETLKLARQGKLDFSSPRWDRISEEAKDLIKKMIVVNSKLRINITEAFEHQWIYNNNKISIIENLDLVKNLSQFDAQNKLRAAIFQFISVQLVSKEESEKLSTTFKELDTNGDGVLSREELLQGIQNANIINTYAAEIMVDEIMKQVDVNESGKVDFIEFISASYVQQSKITTSNLKNAFKIFDIDGNGYISKNELEEVFGGVEIENNVWEDILQACDKNKDGVIQEDEFLSLLQNISL